MNVTTARTARARWRIGLIATVLTLSALPAAAVSAAPTPAATRVASTPELLMPRAVAGRPTAVTAKTLDRAVRLRWQAPSSNGGNTITGYRIQRRTTSGAWKQVATTNGKRSARITGLKNGKTYRFRVAATNASGTGRYSKARQVTLPVVRDIRAGLNHTCAVKVNRTVTCWGFNGAGQLGNGTLTDSPSPVTVSGLTEVRQLATGEKFNCAVTTDRRVSCWGENAFGAIGDGTTDNRSTPFTLDITGVAEVGAGQFHACARKVDGTVWCWGQNAGGQGGSDPTTNAQLTTPTQVPGITGARSLAIGYFFSCAVLADRTMACWGQNGFGQLGDGSLLERFTPGPVTGVSNVRMASAGSNFVCAVFLDDEISCWGDNNDGQIGDGTQTGPRLAATPVAELSGVAHVSAGRNHACARRTTGTLRCWGDNALGELGDGSNTVRPTRIAVDLGGPASFVRTGNDHTCAALRSAQVWCWGFNDRGQLGDQTTTDSNVPVRVTGL